MDVRLDEMTNALDRYDAWPGRSYGDLGCCERILAETSPVRVILGSAHRKGPQSGL
jgi:hypothetical protein